MVKNLIGEKLCFFQYALVKWKFSNKWQISLNAKPIESGRKKAWGKEVADSCHWPSVLDGGRGDTDWGYFYSHSIWGDFSERRYKVITDIVTEVTTLFWLHRKWPSWLHIYIKCFGGDYIYSYWGDYIDSDWGDNTDIDYFNYIESDQVDYIYI